MKIFAEVWFRWMTLVFLESTLINFQHRACEDILRAGIKILGINTNLWENWIFLWSKNLKNPLSNCVNGMTIGCIHYDNWRMIWFKNLKGSPSVEFCGCVLSVFSREQVSNIVLILVKFKLCPMVRGEGTRWLVTALILVEGGGTVLLKWRVGWENVGFRSNCSGLNWLDYAGFRKICTKPTPTLTLNSGEQRGTVLV